MTLTLWHWLQAHWIWVVFPGLGIIEAVTVALLWGAILTGGLTLIFIPVLWVGYGAFVVMYLFCIPLPFLWLLRAPFVGGNWIGSWLHARTFRWDSGLRWTQHEEREDAIRSRCGFLLLPKRIGGETRWLSWAHWDERCEQVRHTYSGPVEYMTYAPRTFAWRPHTWC